MTLARIYLVRCRVRSLSPSLPFVPLQRLRQQTPYSRRHADIASSSGFSSIAQRVFNPAPGPLQHNISFVKYRSSRYLHLHHRIATPTSPASLASAVGSKPRKSLRFSSTPLTLCLCPRTHRPGLIPLPHVFMTASQSRSHGHGHGHDHHHHHHDTTYLTSKNRDDPGVRITRIGLLSNLGMAVGKGIGGYMFNSQALVADAYHALTDMVSDFMTLATVSWSLQPPSSRFPTGYGKVETLGALGVSGLLLCGGLLMGLNALEVLLTQFSPQLAEVVSEWGLFGHGHSHSHGHGHGHGAHEALGPNVNAAWLALGSIVVKEWLYRATMKIAKQRKSSVLASNAIHHRVDALTSIVALLTIGGSHVFSDATWLDPVGGLIISLMVIKAGLGNTKTSLMELADVGVEENMTSAVKKQALNAFANIPDGEQIQLRDVQGVKSGPNFLMEVDLAVPGSWSVARTRQIEQLVREKVGARVRGVKRLKVRFTPDSERQLDFAEEFIAPDISPRSSPEPESEDDSNQSRKKR
ncbi:hypothetical protein FQN57_007006 [Myotisia sp. PD_48]|nr:hypothetical protein FQN57_007006 [Myotisia sp. PD_48]